MTASTHRDRISSDAPRIQDELERLVRIPSIGHEGHDDGPVRTSAEETASILREAGVPDVRFLQPGGHPAVYGEVPGPPGAPTVLLYAHHDVQPEGDAAEWSTPPFEPVVRDGRLYGRGAADDKSGIAAHAAAIRSTLAGGGPPVTVKVLVEGEEECSTAHLQQLVGGNAELLRSDVAVIADGGNERTGVPTIGTSVRGATAVRVRVDVLPRAVHSGSFGGPLPDAITALAHMIASLHDERGDVAVEGLHTFEWAGTPVEEEDLRRETGLHPEVELIGTGTLADRTLSKPSINVLAFESVDMADVANQIVPSARAAIGLRLAPGDDPRAATQALIDHLRAAAPWGVRVDLQPDYPGAGHLVDPKSSALAATRLALAEAFETDDVRETGSGGSVPIVATLAETLPGIEIVILGAGDDLSHYHSIDESVDLGDVGRLALAEALLFEQLTAARLGG